MKLPEFNQLDPAGAQSELLRCCGSSRWSRAMEQARPFADLPGLFTQADAIWAGLSQDDWLEAFSHHPRIGADARALREKFATTAAWAAHEQHGAAGASEAVLSRLAKANIEYERRFGFIFIVCARGKSAQEMLNILDARLENSPETEIRIAANEQAKITKLRLEKLLS